MTQTQDARAAVVEWFETDFKEAAKNTTKTSRTDDGKLNYSFSVTNTSGFAFDSFSFRIKVINKADGSEIGTAVIKAGEWKQGEKKNFRSRLAIPANARSLSFVMYSNSLEFESRELGEVDQGARDVENAMREIGEAVKSVGDALSGSDGSGGVFGELFGTGGMPETITGSRDTATTSRTTTTRTSGGRTTTTTRTTTTSGSRGSSSTSGTRRSGGTYSQRKIQKKLDKIRLGKSGVTLATLIMGALMVIASFADTNTADQMIGYLASGGALLIASGVSKMLANAKAKRVRTYEARVNKNGNTSLDDLASYVGRPFNKVCDDIQKMIADGFFGEAYLDIENRMLVMTRDGKPIESVEEAAAKNKQARRKAAREKGVLPESLDDLITMTDDAEIKSKLRTLRAITKKIDARVEEVPDLEKQVKDFREKYYPEVVRLTDSYNEKIADMGDLGYEKPKEVVGTDSTGAPVLNTNPNYLEEQAAEIKSQLISLIDSVTEASENLLERLHEDDIMDITTDIKSLQATLASKGLLDSDFDIK